MKDMTIDQALAIISQVCANYSGTLKEHQTIQLALQIIEKGLEHKDEPVVEQPAESNTKP